MNTEKQNNKRQTRKTKTTKNIKLNKQHTSYKKRKGKQHKI